MPSRAEHPARPAALGRFLVLTIGLVALLVPAGRARAETIESDLVLIREGDVVSEDLYAVGNRIDIDGVVQGDLMAAAFGEVRIDGRIEGSVTVIASSVVITGDVTGSVRALSPSVRIEGDVGGDLATAAVELVTARGSGIDRDVIGALWHAELDGAVGRDLEGAARTLRIDGSVAGTVHVSTRTLHVGSEAVIGGDLTHRTSGEADIDPGATIGGSELARRPLPPNVRIVGLGLLFRVLLVVFGAALGLTVVWSSVRRAEGAAVALRARAVSAVVTGVGVIALPFLVIAVLAVLVSLTPPESAIPLVLAAIPVILGVVGLLVLGALLAPVPPALLIGGRLLASRSVYARFLAGFVVIAVLALIPLVGRWVLGAFVILGLGAWLVDPVKLPGE